MKTPTTRKGLARAIVAAACAVLVASPARATEEMDVQGRLMVGRGVLAPSADLAAFVHDGCQRNLGGSTDVLVPIRDGWVGKGYFRVEDTGADQPRDEVALSGAYARDCSPKAVASASPFDSNVFSPAGGVPAGGAAALAPIPADAIYLVVWAGRGNVAQGYRVTFIRTHE